MIVLVKTTAEYAVGDRMNPALYVQLFFNVQKQPCRVNPTGPHAYL